MQRKHIGVDIPWVEHKPKLERTCCRHQALVAGAWHGALHCHPIGEPIVGAACRGTDVGCAGRSHNLYRHHCLSGPSRQRQRQPLTGTYNMRLPLICGGKRRFAIMDRTMDRLQQRPGERWAVQRHVGQFDAGSAEHHYGQQQSLLGHHRRYGR